MLLSLWSAMRMLLAYYLVIFTSSFCWYTSPDDEWELITAVFIFRWEFVRIDVMPWSVVSI